MRFPFPSFPGVLVVAWLLVLPPDASAGKSYGSGGGRSYSSGSSRSAGSSSRSSSSTAGRSGSSSRSSSVSSGSRSSGSSAGPSSSGSRSSSGTTASRPSSAANTGGKSSSSGVAGGSKSFPGGRSYSSGSSRSDSSASGYSSGKSYGFGSTRLPSPARPATRSDSTFNPSGNSGEAARPPQLDAAASRAKKEQESRREFMAYQEAQTPKPAAPKSADPAPTGARTVSSEPGTRSASPDLLPPITRRGTRRTVYVPDDSTLMTRPARVETVFREYHTRPVVQYSDPYSSFFWWWLLDRSVEDRARWAYHHRSDMDNGRYQALVEQDTALEARVRELEAGQVPVEPEYVPPGLDRDLMYSDRQLQVAYSTRPTPAGRISFWLLAIPTAIGLGWFLVWLVFFKRWHFSRTVPSSS